MERIGKLTSTKPGLPYTWRNGLILYKNCMVVPPKSTIIEQLLREFHDSPLGGHSGTLLKMSSAYRPQTDAYCLVDVHKIVYPNILYQISLFIFDKNINNI
ncbi:hypothetical protein ACOSQ4_023810 [Xanthoceras sorbifolium]